MLKRREVSCVKVSGRIVGANIDFKTNKPILMLEINERKCFEDLVDDMKDKDKLSVEIKPYREKRSLDANSYMWVLCDKLAKKLSDEKVKITKEDIYRGAIKEIGVFKDFTNLSQNDAKTLRTAWEMLGTGWITELVDFMPDGENVVIRCYYGSSQYNTKQMSRLIDNIVQDCEAVGIETMTPDQIAEMKARWGES